MSHRTNLVAVLAVVLVSVVSAYAGTIAIPGYVSLDFEAGQVMQDSEFYNPEGNNCYFRISLIDPEGSVLWRSELVEPGGRCGRIELARSLEAGTYDGFTLAYECFSLRDKSQMNGAQTKIILNVQ